MFTGIIQEIGEVVSALRQAKSMRVHVRCSMEGLQLGESLSVNGACLTASELPAGGFAADISEETIGCTTLGELREGQRVNLERALLAGERLGGHLVSGHVDGVGELCSREPPGEGEEGARFRFRAPPALARYLAPKGAICVDGVSLTVNRVMQEQFEVQIVPHTMRETLFGSYQPGDRVNLEADLIARYLERLLQQS